MPRLISIDGNIGSGKSTFIHYLKEYFNKKIMNPDTPKILFIEEPVALWNSFKDNENKTILENFYEDKKKYAFSFQMLAYISRLSIIKEATQSGLYNIIVTERSIFTDKNIFAKMLYDTGHINKIEYKIYNTWFNEFCKDFPTVEYIYLKTTPITAFQRIKQRSRKGENISLDYINSCHKYHEEWFNQSNFMPVIFDGNINITTDVQIINDWINAFEQIINGHVLKFDGASKGNPGKCGCGYVILYENTIIESGKKFLDLKNTNNYPEYNGLILGLEKCIELNIKNVLILGDSKLVIKQIKKEWKIESENLKPLYDKTIKLLYNFNKFELKHIKRTENSDADRLANLAIKFEPK